MGISVNRAGVGTGHPVAQAGATASIRDEAYFRESRARVVAGREAMTRELITLTPQCPPTGTDRRSAIAQFLLRRIGTGTALGRS